MCVYEIYVPSFSDSNGDGLGDIIGVRTKLDYLVDLGVDAIWLTPFYPSPMRDHGYDVRDYCNVDERFGTLADIDSLIEAAHRRGVRVIVDLVVNHTSSDHPWFEESRLSLNNPYRDYYVWRYAAPGGGPPNNWLSHFGGPAWTFDQETGQYWLHLFLPEQPDLNWNNPAVADEIEAVIQFWLQRGVDGFRVDVAHGLVKDQLFRDNPPSEKRSASSDIAVREFHTTTHEFDHDRPEVVEIYRRWNVLVARFDAVLIGEVNIPDPAKVARYSKSGDGLHLAMSLGTVEWEWNVHDLAILLRAATQQTRSLAWALSNHDRPRSATRFGGGSTGARRALVLGTVMAGLPEAFVIYQGEELGLPDGEVPIELARDPIWRRDPTATGRDGSRTPMPWSPGQHFGFTSGTPWLPLGGRSDSDCASIQVAARHSWFDRWRNLLMVRRQFTSATEVEWMSAPFGMVAYSRGCVSVIANLTAEERTMVIDHPDSTLLFSTDRSSVHIADSAILIGPETALIVKLQ